MNYDNNSNNKNRILRRLCYVCAALKVVKLIKLHYLKELIFKYLENQMIALWHCGIFNMLQSFWTTENHFECFLMTSSTFVAVVFFQFASATNTHFTVFVTKSLVAFVDRCLNVTKSSFLPYFWLQIPFLMRVLFSIRYIS